MCGRSVTFRTSLYNFGAMPLMLYRPDRCCDAGPQGFSGSYPGKKPSKRLPIGFLKRVYTYRRARYEISDSSKNLIVPASPKETSPNSARAGRTVLSAFMRFLDLSCQSPLAGFLTSLSSTLKLTREGNNANSNPDERLTEYKVAAQSPRRFQEGRIRVYGYCSRLIPQTTPCLILLTLLWIKSR